MVDRLYSSSGLVVGREKREVNERERVVFGSRCLGVGGSVDVGKQNSQAWQLVRRVQG